MPIPIAVGVAAAIAALGVAYLVYEYWDQILEWLHDFIPKVTRTIRKYARMLGPEFEWVAVMVADELDNLNAKIEHKLYHKLQNGNWMEETTQAREIPDSELPPAVRRKLRQRRVDNDITDEMEDELGMKISA